MPKGLLQVAIKWKETLNEAKELIEAKEYKRALVLLDDALKLADMLNQDDDPEELRAVDLRIADTLERIAYAYHCLGQLEEAEPLYRRAIKIAEPRLFGMETEELSTENLAKLLCETGRGTEGDALREAIRKKYPSSPETGLSIAPNTPENNIMSTLRSLSRKEPNLIIPMMKEVLELIETIYGATSIETIDALDTLGNASQMGAEYHERALRIAIKRAANDPDEAVVAHAMRNLSGTHSDPRFCNALVVQARAIEKKIGARNVFEQALGVLQSVLGSMAPADMPLDEAEAVFSAWKQQLPVEPPFVDVALTDSQRYERVVALLEKALAAVYRIEKDSEHPLSTICLLSVASRVHKEFGNIPQAKAMLEEEMKIIANHWGEGHSMMVDTFEEYNAL